MKRTTIAFAIAMLCISTAAFAKHQNGAPKAAPAHHCQLNGAEVQKSKKACLKAGGTWELGAAATHATAPTPAK